jgi:hypothetical protein
MGCRYKHRPRGAIVIDGRVAQSRNVQTFPGICLGVVLRGAFIDPCSLILLIFGREAWAAVFFGPVPNVLGFAYSHYVWAYVWTAGIGISWLADGYAINR